MSELKHIMCMIIMNYADGIKFYSSAETFFEWREKFDAEMALVKRESKLTTGDSFLIHFFCFEIIEFVSIFLK